MMWIQRTGIRSWSGRVGGSSALRKKSSSLGLCLSVNGLDSIRYSKTKGYVSHLAFGMLGSPQLSIPLSVLCLNSAFSCRLYTGELFRWMGKRGEEGGGEEHSVIKRFLCSPGKTTRLVLFLKEEREILRFFESVAGSKCSEAHSFRPFRSSQAGTIICRSVAGTGPRISPAARSSARNGNSYLY